MCTFFFFFFLISIWSAAVEAVQKTERMQLYVCMLITPAWLCSEFCSMFLTMKHQFSAAWYHLPNLFDKSTNVWNQRNNKILQRAFVLCRHKSSTPLAPPCMTSHSRQLILWFVRILLSVTLFYSLFAVLLWIEVKTTAGKNWFSTKPRGTCLKPTLSWEVILHH